MCAAPDIEEPKQYQASKAPVFNTAAQPRSKTGRQGTILTGSGSGAGQAYSPAGGKTLLGQ